ncbi:hypothetical protein K488DRAFT_69987 [Vararia minispora EC-137]|uniref:Uncharacterized protein n=1 Tax=Vararia minispora EC-137 TaxID=1314806 RepID=A0ACB8QN48_9AGAM|nr:hypothetical protein K488DRAFT_69987 [Vararia minispora EC-137]
MSSYTQRGSLLPPSRPLHSRSPVPPSVQHALDELAGQQLVDRRSAYDGVFKTFVGDTTFSPLSMSALTQEEQYFRRAVEEKIRIKHGRHNASVRNGGSINSELVFRELVEPRTHDDVVVHLESAATKLMNRDILHPWLSERLAFIERQVGRRASYTVPEAVTIRKIRHIFSAPDYANDPPTAARVAALMGEIPTQCEDSHRKLSNYV